MEMPLDLYLDAAASAPPTSRVIAVMSEVQRSCWGNPSSLHIQGLRAAECLERSRQAIAYRLGAEPDELIFTSGATESVHLAIHGLAASLRPGRLVISAVEHPAVEAAANSLRSYGWSIARWPVDDVGRIQLDYLGEMLAPPTRLVSLIWGQNEIGTLQPIEIVGRACRDLGLPIHTDATQVLSQGLPNWRSLPVDLLSGSGHKLRGPHGIGILLRRCGDGALLCPIQGGGSQENGLRAGTEPVALVAGLAEAFRDLPHWSSVINPMVPSALRDLRDDLLSSLLQIPGLRLSGDPRYRLPHHISILAGTPRHKPVDGRAVVRKLARQGVSISSGSACSAGHATDSAILTAIGIDPIWRRSGLRITLGPWLEQSVLDGLPDLIAEAIAAASPP
ncbi:cysteine desulfurase [cyanobiont of Ornithocercus magnificus]|nr:cysteine desulfurase [cyanobiont of Ornithocercus magnificus]